MSAAHKPAPPVPGAALDARPASQPPEAAPAPANTASNVKISVNHSDAATDLSSEASPEEIADGFRKLRDRFPPSREFSLYLDNLSLQLHCPPPLLTPMPYPPRPAAPPEYPLAAYSVHAPVRRPRTGPPVHSEASPSSTTLRYRLMGKASADPRFHYTPPSRPISRVHSAAAMRSTPEPANRSGSTRGNGAPELAPPGGSRMQVMQKTCAVCRRLHDVLRTATKARYCVQCEKLRWQLRAFGGKVHHLRTAYEQVGDASDTPAILQAAKVLARLDAPPSAAPAAAAAPAAQRPPGPQARPMSAGASDSRVGSLETSSAVAATDVDTDADMDGGEARPAAADGPSLERGPAGTVEAQGGVKDEMDAATASNGGEAAAVTAGEEDLDELAALLAGHPSSGGQV